MSWNALVGAVVVVLACAAPAVAQRPWVEATGPNVTVVTDDSAGRARDLVWQFEQVREAMGRIFPWVRLRSPRPLVVVAARNEASMRVLAPEYFAPPYTGVVSVSSEGFDRAYIALRADVRTEDREGVNPYETAYWAFAVRALSETSSALPAWLRRGMASVVANTLVRNQEIQLGRIIERHVVTLRTRPRMSLSEVISLIDGEDSRIRQEAFLAAHDAHSWALVHFLVWANDGARQQGLDEYFKGLLRGADPLKSLGETLGDVARLETAFHVYISRDIFPFTRFLTEAKLKKEAFPVRTVTPAEVALLQASLHVAMRRPAEAKARLAEARGLQPGIGDEVEGLIAESEGRRDDARAAFGRAIDQPFTTWFAPYRLAMFETPTGQAGYRRMRQWLEQATARNPLADEAWASLAVAMAAGDDRDAALAALARALELAPLSSDNRRYAAYAYLRLGMMAEARQAAGLARAYARTPQERGMSQDALAAVARAAAAGPAPIPDVPSVPASTVTAPAVTDGRDLAPATVAPRTPTPLGEPATPGRSIGFVIDDCFLENGRCQAALPQIERECRDPSTPDSGPVCRAAGYILDVGLGLAAAPRRAAELYALGCERRDEVSCVRLATLRSLGRGLPRDQQAAVAVLEPSCERGLQEACYRLGLHLAATGVTADRARARQTLTASCAAGFAESCEALKTLPK